MSSAFPGLREEISAKSGNHQPMRLSSEVSTHFTTKKPKISVFFWSCLLLTFYFLESIMSFTTQMSSEQYLNSRRKDYFDLLNDISENRDLGYCQLLDHQTLLMKGKKQVFKSHADALAYILRTFW